MVSTMYQLEVNANSFEIIRFIIEGLGGSWWALMGLI